MRAMLQSMVAMPTLDLIVSTVWVGALAVVLLAQAVYAWLGHRHWVRFAREAARLAEATRSPTATALPSRGPELKLLPGGLPSQADSAPVDEASKTEAEA
jgi:hypothetical protein